MINNSIIKDYAEDYILNSGQQLDDCDSFPNDDFIEAFEEA